MSLVLTPPRPMPLRGPALIAMLVLSLFASTVSLAPTLARSAAAASTTVVCKCAHCPGGLKCCCARRAGVCPVSTP